MTQEQIDIAELKSETRHLNGLYVQMDAKIEKVSDDVKELGVSLTREIKTLFRDASEFRKELRDKVDRPSWKVNAVMNVMSATIASMATFIIMLLIK